MLATETREQQSCSETTSEVLNIPVVLCGLKKLTELSNYEGVSRKSITTLTLLK